MMIANMTNEEKRAYDLGVKLGSKAMAKYFYDTLTDVFESYRREDRDTMLIDDAKAEVTLALGRAFKPIEKAEAPRKT